ncbi:MAG: UDP-3-O-(3-hydroxymyristoyl)glucosamine N-acyltransferase [Gammaproteobacteria bacterium]|nr:MAG: UDP-3-O-(3-hydroxymyristoyl)glucosamine N-acyltransferase [Gammaproteobacteria bacterium]
MGYSLRDIAEELGAQVHGDENCRIDHVATLAGAGPGGISFLANRRYRPQLLTTRASAVILEAEFLSSCPVAALVVSNPYLGYARVAGLLVPEQPVLAGVHPSAYVSDRATVDASAWIGPQAVVEGQARVGARSHIGPGCVIDRGATIGDDCTLKANVTICHDVRIGDRALLHPGVVIGADGFGIANDGGVWVKVPQLGAVVIADDVEIGANTTIDRGALADTVIEEGVKLDNLIQIGHNVRIGAHTAIAAGVAIGGSATIGKRCTIGGAASVAGHLEIVDDVHLTATSAVPKSITEPGLYSSGMPIQDNRTWRRNVVRMRQLDEMAKRLKDLEKRLDEG